MELLEDLGIQVNKNQTAEEFTRDLKETFDGGLNPGRSHENKALPLN